mmetsp:Transcript_73582/g.203140  ORF Transcript_73582/g.203140 Transcript_73582/m.203140 type:complete len:207 (-) Transcript_73582:801-1421(-)
MDRLLPCSLHAARVTARDVHAIAVLLLRHRHRKHGHAADVPVPLECCEEELLLPRVDGPGPHDAHPAQHGRARDVPAADGQAARQGSAPTEAALALYHDSVGPLVLHVTLALLEYTADVLRPGRAAIVAHYADVGSSHLVGLGRAVLAAPLGRQSLFVVKVAADDETDLGLLEESGQVALLLLLILARRLPLLGGAVRVDRAEREG